ncbi:MAG: trigger factor, partial [Gallionellaceae bacterium]|nr:trigger factor [Gallionellaceae bacterium]
MASVETLGALERRLNSSVSQQQIRGEIDARIKRLGRNAKMPGFRPGKVPMHILQQQYGPQVRQEVLGDALQDSFAEAVRDNNLRVAGMPNFELKNDDPAADQLEYSATFEVVPEVVMGDVAAETVDRVGCDLSEADVENTLMTVRKQRAVFETADRAAQDGDRVTVDFSGTLDGVVFEGGEAKNVPVVLGAGHMLPDFEAPIAGMKAGETKSFDMTFPADYHGKNVAGKQVTFTVTLHKVEEARLPEIDEAFARSLGVADGDVEKLKADVRENLRREVERRLKQRNKNNVMELLLKISQFEVPKALVGWETQNLMQQTLRDMESRGVKVPQGATLPPELFADRAQKRARLGLIFSELAKRHGLDATPE